MHSRDTVEVDSSNPLSPTNIMSEINITLPDKSVKVLPRGVTPQEVANDIGPGLARAVVVSKINGELKDLAHECDSC